MADIADEAAVLIETVRSEGLRRVSEALAVPGEAECIGCGEDIAADRRAALPSARRCIICQSRVEVRDGGRAPHGRVVN